MGFGGILNSEGYTDSIKRLSIIAVSAVTFGIVVSAAGLFRLSSIEKLETNVKSAQASKYLPENSFPPEPEARIANEYLNPVLGPLAVNKCQHSCKDLAQKDQAVCWAACNNFSLSVFGRRIGISNPDPSDAFKNILKACQLTSIDRPRHTSRQAWEADLGRALAEFQRMPRNHEVLTYSTARLRYEMANQVNRTYKHAANPVPELNNMDEAILTTSCLRMHLSLIEMGISLAAQAGDIYSENYYRSLDAELFRITNEAEKNLFSSAQAFRTPELQNILGQPLAFPQSPTAEKASLLFRRQQGGVWFPSRPTANEQVSYCRTARGVFSCSLVEAQRLGVLARAPRTNFSDAFIRYSTHGWVLSSPSRNQKLSRCQALSRTFYCLETEKTLYSRPPRRNRQTPSHIPKVARHLYFQSSPAPFPNQSSPAPFK